MLPRKIPKAPKRSSRWRSQAHCNFVRGHACSVCDSTAGIEVAHVRLGSDAGMGRKPSDFYTISLCGGIEGHHAEQHRLGEATFSAKYSIDMSSLAAEFAIKSPKSNEIRQVKRERGLA